VVYLKSLISRKKDTLGSGQRAVFRQNKSMRIFLRGWIGLLCLTYLGAGELETRVHSYEYASPALVEKQLRAMIPEGPRISMNPRAKQVIVIADDEMHTRIASMLKVLGRPPRELVFWLRHNREVFEFTVSDGVPLSLPVSQTPPQRVVEMARSRLDPEARSLPVVGSALQAHVILLRENPAVLRMRVTPAMIFGVVPPYEVVEFKTVTSDLLVDTENYVEVQDVLKRTDFYREFLKTQPDPDRSARPVSLLLSFEGLTFEQEEIAVED